MPFAMRDTAWGKLDAKDLGKVHTLFRDIYIPIMGMTTIIDIFTRVSERRGWDTGEDVSEDIIEEKNREKRVWNEVMKQMHEPFNILSAPIDQGLEHAGICLELLPRPKKAAKKPAPDAKDADVEAQGGSRPGEAGFAQVVDAKACEFYSRKDELLRTWFKGRALVADEEKRDDPQTRACAKRRQNEQAQLYMVLYMENLMHTAG